MVPRMFRRSPRCPSHPASPLARSFVCRTTEQRYPSRAQLDEHQTSPAFKNFKDWWTYSGVVLEKSGMSCIETSIGYMSKPTEM